MTTRARSLERATFSNHGSVSRRSSFVLDTPATAFRFLGAVACLDGRFVQGSIKQDLIRLLCVAFLTIIVGSMVMQKPQAHWPGVAGPCDLSCPSVLQ